MSSNPTIQSPSELRNMSDTELDLVAQAASASGFNPYNILYGPPGNSSSPQPPPGPCTSTLAGFSSGSDMSFETQFSLSPPPARTPSPSPLPTPSPTPRRGRRPMSLLNLAGEQVRARHQSYGLHGQTSTHGGTTRRKRKTCRTRLLLQCAQFPGHLLWIFKFIPKKLSCPLPVAGGGGSGGSGAGGSDTSGGSSNTSRT